jgi:glycosyltransferase involved in cell wall biosynthesis
MNISVIIDNNPWLQNTADANRWLTLINGLCRQKVQIKLHIYGGYHSEKEANDWGKKGSKNNINYKYIKPKLIKGYWNLRFNNYIGFSLRQKRIIKRLYEDIKNENEIIWTDSSVFGFKLAVYFKKKQVNQKFFLEVSEFFDIYRYNKGNILQRLKGFNRQKYFENKAINSYDGLAFMTKTLLLHYKKYMKHSPKLLHLPMTVDLDRFNKDVDALVEFKKPYVAFVGVMDDAKDGVNVLIKAFHEIAKDYPKLKLYLVGGWNYDTPAHQELIKELELKDRVFWVGEYPRDTIPSIICNAKLLVLPRPDSKQAQGGFPTKLGEYLATGRPVCATTVGEIPEYLEDNKSVYFAKPGSVTSFVNAMSNALKDDEKANNVGEQGKKVAELYFNKKIQSKILYNFLKQL